MNFSDSLKKWFYLQGTTPDLTNARVPVLDANGNPTGSTPLANLAHLMVRDVFYIDDNIDTPSQKITGNTNGTVLRYIRRHTHRYLVKKTGDGTAAICQLDDTDSTKYFDGTTAALDGTEGDVMVKLPEFYYKCEETSTTHKWKVSLALSNQNGDMQHWDGTQLIGAYEGVVVDSNLYSRSGVASTGSVSQADFKTYARNRGTGYTIEKWQQHNVYAMLFYAQYATTDSQGTCGSGTNSSTKATGGTNSLGMTDTVDGGNGDSGSINCWGIENAWGNKAEWIDNVVVNYNDGGNRFVITEDDGTTRTVISQVGNNEHVYPTKMVLGEKFDLIAAPDNVIGDTTIGYCDGFYLSKTSSRMVSVSSHIASADCGVAYAHASNSASIGYTYYGARLSFKGTLTDYDNVASFKAL